MAVDRQGLRLTGSGQAADAYDRAIEHLIRFQPAVADAAAKSAAVDCWHPASTRSTTCTLLEGALRAGQLDLAAALVSERLSVREGSTYA